VKFLYVHGFNSSSASIKARLIREELLRLDRGHEFRAPDLPHLPSRAMQTLEQEITRQRTRNIALVGSSLGGHYATWLAEKYDLVAVLVNPAVNPHVALTPCLGRQTNIYTGERYRFTLRHLSELEQYNVTAISHPERYLLLVQTGDKVLDYRHALEKYRGAQQVVIEGGEHGFRNFFDYVPLILGFAAGKLVQPATASPRV